MSEGSRRKLDISAALREATDRFRAGDYAGAERLYRAAIAAAPQPLNYADLGVILEAQGRFEEAGAAYRKAIELAPEEPRPHYNRGNLLRDRGRHDEAIACYRRAILLKPEFADARNNLGRLLLDAGQVAEARTHLEAAVAADPRHHYAHNNLGNAYQQEGELAQAARCYERALELKPDYAEAWGNLGSARLELGRIDEAVAHCGKAAALQPDSAAAHFNLANALAAALRMDAAIACFERALVLAPENAGYHWNYATALLLTGDCARGWREYEWRWAGCPELAGRRQNFPQPQWRGEDLAGRTILLHREQGFGDAIQFIRYAPLVAARGARVVVACQPELTRLLSGVDGVSQVVADRERLPRFDVHSPLLSLPLVFETTLDSIPARVPYLRSDPALAAAWRARMDPAAALNVGLIWGGWAGNRIDRSRSLKLAEFAPLARARHVRFYGLQKGEQAAEAQSPPAGMQWTDWSAELSDFADTAALMDNLDLVIAVDTAGAHLAGALGRPVWLLNRRRTDWRWLLGRDDSPWYPTLRIFRQAAQGDWWSVMQAVADALHEMRR